MSYLEPLFKPVIDSVVINNDTFNFLNYTGRKAYYAQGYFGQGLVGAVIDTGCNTAHVEFRDDAGKVRLAGYKSFCDYTDGAITDDHGHGTFTAGEMFGRSCGLLSRAKMLVIKVLDGNGDNTVSNIIAGFEYAAQWKDANGNHADFVSASLSIQASAMTAAEIERFHNAIKALVALDIPVYVSSGNTGTTDVPRYPAYFDEVITVGAVDIDKAIAHFSTRSNAVDLCQVGVNVVGADYKTTNGYCLMSGTSMSTPTAAATGGLKQCKHKVLFGKRMPEPVVYTSDKLDTLDLGALGVDKEFGAGFFTLEPMPVIKARIKLGELKYNVNGTDYLFDIAPRAENGRTLACHVGPGRWTTGGHYILWWGYGDGNCYINDPSGNTAKRNTGTLAELQMCRKAYMCFWPKEDNMTKDEAKTIVKEKAGLSNASIQFIADDYRYGDELIIKLATAMK